MNAIESGFLIKDETAIGAFSMLDRYRGLSSGA